MEYTRREYQYFAKELQLCRANAKTECIQQALADYRVQNPEVNLTALLHHMPPPSVKKATRTPQKTPVGKTRPLTRSARKLVMTGENDDDAVPCAAVPLALVAEEEVAVMQTLTFETTQPVMQTLTFDQEEMEDETKKEMMSDAVGERPETGEEAQGEAVSEDDMVEDLKEAEALNETEDVMVEAEDVMVETEDVMVEAEDVMVEADDVMVETEDVMVETEDVMDETEELVDSTSKDLNTTTMSAGEPEEDPRVEICSNASETPEKLKSLTQNMDALQLDAATEVKELVESHEHLHFLPTGRVQCLLTHHEMKPTKRCISEYLSGKKYGAAALGRFEKYEPMFVEDPNNTETRLYCTVTDSYIKKGVDHIKKHMAAKKYQEAYPDWEMKNTQVHLKGIPSPMGVKTYFSSP